jgi:hypothetical protein
MRASVEMRSVFASPGTPTSKQLPPENSATKSCSTTSRWPMITLPISLCMAS